MVDSDYAYDVVNWQMYSDITGPSASFSIDQRASLPLFYVRPKVHHDFLGGSRVCVRLLGISTDIDDNLSDHCTYLQTGRQCSAGSLADAPVGISTRLARAFGTAVGAGVDISWCNFACSNDSLI